MAASTVAPTTEATATSTTSKRPSRIDPNIANSDSSSNKSLPATFANNNSSWRVALLSSLVWPSMVTVPLLLSLSSSPLHFKRIFPEEWYTTTDGSPKPLGLCLGIFAVVIGQVGIWLFLFGYLRTTSTSRPIQTKPLHSYAFWTFGVPTHVAQLEGFILLGAYLAGTWMCGWMPASYYEFDDDRGIQWELVAASLIVQDVLQYIMHRLEHTPGAIYKYTHKPHHKFTNPSWFDAFNGSICDTVLMILVPLYITTAWCLPHANVFTYMAFGSTYAAWLTLIHAEVALPWDAAFRRLGLGTPADHHVHHKFFKYNFGHTFMWWDKLCGTYRDPKQFAPHAFHEGV